MGVVLSATPTFFVVDSVIIDLIVVVEGVDTVSVADGDDEVPGSVTALVGTSVVSVVEVVFEMSILTAKIQFDNKMQLQMSSNLNLDSIFSEILRDQHQFHGNRSGSLRCNRITICSRVNQITFFQYKTSTVEFVRHFVPKRVRGQFPGFNRDSM